jgi:AraC-like DNA-binding protein
MPSSSGARPDFRESQAVTAQRWRELISSIYAPVQVDAQPEAIIGQIRNVDVDGIQVSRLIVGKHRTQHAGDNPDDRVNPKLVLCVQLSGVSKMTQTGRVAVLRPGDMSVYNTNEGYELEFGEEAEVMGVIIPWNRLAQSPGTLRDLAGRVMLSNDPVVRSVVNSIDGIEPELQKMTIASRGRLIHHIVGLVETLCHAQQEQLLATGEATASNDRLSQAMGLIEDNLANPALNPDFLAANLFMSKRSLQQLSASAGFSVAAWIRTRRLEMCRADLLGMPERSISEVCAQWGFSSASHFSQLFKATYGRTPAQWRRENVLRQLER